MHPTRLRNELHAHFGLEENHMVYAGIALGRPYPEAAPALRISDRNLFYASRMRIALWDEHPSTLRNLG